MTVTGEDLSKIPGILGPRKADGSLPDVDFLRLKKGSHAIDKGEDLGFPFAGEAPDLGAFEYGMSSSSSKAKSSSSAEESSSSKAKSSSSAKSSTSSKDSSAAIMAKNAHFAEISGPADVFDLQGRYLGTLQTEELRGKFLTDAIRAKFRNPGIYLVRRGQSIQRINVQ
jgi:hypothetical protein